MQRSDISVKHISASLQDEGGNFHHVPKASVLDCIHWKLIVREPLPSATNQRLPKWIITRIFWFKTLNKVDGAAKMKVDKG